ncbi:uncharacterized protein Z518_11145 [Rhinocladiella mackenziei CBS 650.93]|uniref:Uncharacterized protein n=1 Tax=Rhinocladiella mackenziei CBS 650.93 TaxID=1442369 RepID=A0A0D2GMY8_9EURO|nr:uncharacterized protein Z518_11145 [Rhinocladiella mackenziei CBS 650.93]KIW99732.1 hypothetical protein Z518_11145 [Rhinocladiella mackenziei CBS 650.93]
MGFVLSCFAPCFGSRSGATQTQPPECVEARSADRVQNLPGANYTLQPYLPMSSNGEYSIFLQADGFGNKKVLVEAYLDTRLKKSIISENKARETNADPIPLPEPVSLEDDQGRWYTCSSQIIVRWYLPGKNTRTFEETFYVFAAHGDVDVAVRLRGDIEPLGQPAAVHDDAQPLFTLANATPTEREKQEQKAHEKKENAKTARRKKDRMDELWKKYNGNRGGGAAGNGGQRTNNVSPR